MLMDREDTRETRVLVVDPEVLVREGLVAALGQVQGLAVRGCSFGAQEISESARSVAPHVALVSVTTGWEQAVESLRVGMDGVRIIGMASGPDLRSAYGFMKAGAVGLIRRSADLPEVVAAVQAAAAGHAVLRVDLLQALLEQVTVDGRRRREESPDRLTPRQLQILGAVAHGLTDAQIARTLNLSLSLVKSEVRVILAKTRTRNRSEMVAFALRHGVIRGSGGLGSYV